MKALSFTISLIGKILKTGLFLLGAVFALLATDDRDPLAKRVAAMDDEPS